MKTVQRIAMALMLTGAVMASGGCLKMKAGWILNPDGSGKMEMTVGLGEQIRGMMAMDASNTSDPFEDFHPGKAARELQGIVAGTKGKRFEKDGFEYQTITLYFDDINAVKPVEKEEGDLNDEQAPIPQVAFQKMEDGTFVLSFVDEASKEKLEGPENPLANVEDKTELDFMKGMMKGMLAGFELRYSFTMPGTVTSATGLKMRGREAWFAVDSDALLEGMENPDHAPPTEGKIVAAAAGDMTAEMEAYRKERDAAVAAWKDVQKEWKVIEERIAERESATVSVFEEEPNSR